MKSNNFENNTPILSTVNELSGPKNSNVPFLSFIHFATVRRILTLSGLKSFNVFFESFIHFAKEALAIRRVFSLVDMITNTKFSNCILAFKIGADRQQNMQSKHQNTFQSHISLAKQ